MKIILALPVYNEEKILEASVMKLHDYMQSNFAAHDWNIIIADNGSTDQTQKIAQNLTLRSPRISVKYTAKRGRGGALRQIWLNNQADVYAYCDIDLSTDIKHLKNLIFTAFNKADLAIGSRYLPESKINRNTKRLAISKIYIWMIKILFGTNYTDYQCGFKALHNSLTKKIIPATKDDKWFFDTELILLTHFSKKPYIIKEIPINWEENPDSKVKLTTDMLYFTKKLFEFRKKITCQKNTQI